MRYTLFFLTACLWLVSTNALATDYIYRDLMANTIPSTQCDEKSSAISNAAKPYTMDRFSKKFCQTQGYGWHVEAIKDKGTLVCNECSEQNKHQCHIQDIVVTCKRIKPGSVGMLPGKG
jgi:hypothetical protein